LPGFYFREFAVLFYLANPERVRSVEAFPLAAPLRCVPSLSDDETVVGTDDATGAATADDITRHYFRRRVRRVFLILRRILAMYALAAALPFFKRAARVFVRFGRRAVVVFGEARLARRRFAVVRPPFLPADWKSRCVAGVCCANPANPPGGTTIDFTVYASLCGVGRPATRPALRRSISLTVAALVGSGAESEFEEIGCNFRRSA
jgi:hypothetical protein